MITCLQRLSLRRLSGHATGHERRFRSLRPVPAASVRAVTEEQGLLQHAMGELSSALANAVGATSLIQHRLLKGEFRERRVIAGLRPFIPRRYEMSSGVIVNAGGHFSRQQDIILSDSLLAPPFLAAGELGVHPIEAVAAVIEVKSVATAQAMREAVENIASVKRLASDEPRGFGASCSSAATCPPPPWSKTKPARPCPSSPGE